MGSHTNNRTISEGSFSDALSALSLLRSYNSIIAPNPDVCRFDSYMRSEYTSREPETTGTGTMLTAPHSPLTPTAPFTLSGLLQPPLLAAMPPLVPPVNIAHPFQMLVQIALRATMLEHENAILRAQVVTLREECQSLRQLLIKQRMPSMQSVDQLTDRSISSSVTLTPTNSITSLPCQV